MRRLIAVLVVALAVTFSANISFASGNEGTGNGNPIISNEQIEIQKQKMLQEQGINYAPQSNNNRSIGNLPFTGTHGIGAAEFPLNDYGHFITQFSLKTSVQFMRVLTSAEVQTIKDVNDGMEGTEKWEKRNRKIIPSPIIKRTYQGSPNSKGYFINPKDFVEQILPRLSLKFGDRADEHIMGIMLYNSKLDKENPVNVPHFQVRAFEDLAPLGANVFVPVDQFFQGYFVPEGFEFSVSGIFSWISKSFLNGGAVSPSAGVAKQQNTEFGRPGAAFVVCSVPLSILFPPPPPTLPPAPTALRVVEPPKPVCDKDKLLKKLEEDKKKVEGCPYWCKDNLGYRYDLAVDYADLYICTGDKTYLKEVHENLRIAEDNYNKGPDTKTKQNIADSKRTLAKVYRLKAWAISQSEGQVAADKYADKHGLERYPETLKLSK